MNTDILHPSSAEGTEELSAVLAGLSDKHQAMGRRMYLDLKRKIRMFPDTTEAYAVEKAREALKTFSRLARCGRIP
jgi:hypothetical protein